MKQIVRITSGRWRGRFGWIAGDLTKQHPAVTKVIVFLTVDCGPVPIAHLEPHEQIEMRLEERPERKTPPAMGRRRFVGLNPW